MELQVERVNEESQGRQEFFHATRNSLGRDGNIKIEILQSTKMRSDQGLI
jgi:hypothetical protein